MACASAWPNEPGVRHDVIWQPEARSDLYAISDWVADQSDSETALGYVARIEAFVARLERFPNRGTARASMPKGMRTVTFERRIIVAYDVQESLVRILSLIGTARDFRLAFKNDR